MAHKRCIKQINYGDWGRTNPCERMATAGEWCWQHAPKEMEKRKKKRDAEQDAKSIKRRQEWQGPSAILAIKRALEELESNNPKIAECTLRAWLQDHNQH